MDAITLKRILRKDNYKLIPVQADNVCMIAGPDEALGVYMIVRDIGGTVEKAISRGANALCGFRDKLDALIQETLDDIEIKITLYLFCYGKHSISQQSRMMLSLKGVRLINLDDPAEILSNYFPRFELEGEEVKNYDAYVEYLRTVAKFINSYQAHSDIAPVKRNNEIGEHLTIPIFQQMEDMHQHTSFEIKNFDITTGKSGNENL